MVNKNEEDDSELFLNFLTSNLNQLSITNKLNKFLSEDILSINLLSSLIQGYPYIPFSGGSLRPSSLNHIVNDIVINNRSNIIEFGSGISTIVIARLIKKNNLDAILVSVEHDLDWGNQLSKLLNNENLQDVVKLCHAPLSECALSLDNNLWFNSKSLNAYIKDKKFDMVIVDGPPAWMKEKKRSRYPAFPFMIDNLHENYSVYLDDAMREGEQAILKLWEEKFSIKFKYSGNSLAYYYHGNSFFTEPYVYIN